VTRGPAPGTARRLAVALPVLLLALGARAVRAQEPEVERARWSTRVEVGYNATRGNAEFQLFSGGFRIRHLETRRFEFEWGGQLLYGESGDSVIARSLRSSLSFDLRPQDRVSPFVFIEAERDRFRRLDARTNTGAGAKYRLWRFDGERRRGTASVSAAVLHDHERFTVPLADGATSRTAARWSFRGKVEHRFRSDITLESTTWYKPVFVDAGDYNIDGTTKAVIRLTSRLSTQATWLFRRDSTPPPDVRRNDQILQLGVIVEF
jgi:hypothetical protein